MLARRAHAQAERRAVEQPRDHRHCENAEPDQWVADERHESRARLLDTKTGHAR
jgi:hypothetical protein